MQISVNSEEYNFIKELNNTLVITKERLHNLKIDVAAAIGEIQLEPCNYMHNKVPVEALDSLEHTTLCTL
jgi:hypothetical protein